MQLTVKSHIHTVIAGTHPAGTSTRHASRVLPCYELIFVRDGVLHIGEEDQQYQIRKNNWLLLDANKYHFGTEDLDENMWFYWVCFRTDEKVRLRSTAGTNRITLEKTGEAARPRRLHQLFQNLLDDQEAGILSPDAAAIALLPILLEVQLPATHAQASRTSAQLLAQRAADHITRNLLSDTSMSTSTISDVLHCNPDYLGRVFRQTFQETVTDFIHRQRVARAWNHLRQTDQSIEQIAYDVGYNDARYFRRMFHRFTGMSPGEYRRLQTGRSL